MCGYASASKQYELHIKNILLEVFSRLFCETTRPPLVRSLPCLTSFLSSPLSLAHYPRLAPHHLQTDALPPRCGACGGRAMMGTLPVCP